MNEKNLSELNKILKNWKPKLTKEEKYIFAEMMAQEKLKKLYHEAYGKDIIIG